MNILPKKSWHVRTKKNIARVRKDEAKAAEEEKETQRRIALAAQEARTALLRERATKRLQEAAAGSSSDLTEDDNRQLAIVGGVNDEEGEQEEDLRFGLPLGSLRDVVQPDGHVNFFQDVEAGKRQGGTNEEYEEEKKKEQEDYEKKIGYLVYLGQDSLEHSREKPWYSKIDRGKSTEIEKEKAKERDLDLAASLAGGLEEKSKSVPIEEIKMTKSKSYLDPLKDIRKYLSTPGIKRKLDSLPSSSKSVSKDYSAPLPSKKNKLEDESRKERKHKKDKHKKSKKSKKHKKHSKSKKHSKKHSKDSSDSSESTSESFASSDNDNRKRSKLEQLRAERLQREREERKRAEQVVAKMRGETPAEPKAVDVVEKIAPTLHVKQKYNSQFNPHLARQNYD